MVTSDGDGPSRSLELLNSCFFIPSAFDSPETIELEINTDSSEGLILWQGVVSPPPALSSSTSLTRSLTSSSPD